MATCRSRSSTGCTSTSLHPWSGERASGCGQVRGLGGCGQQGGVVSWVGVVG